MDKEAEAALKLQRDARLRAKARGQALIALSKKHPEEFAALYKERREALEKNDG